jgi:hypothetical protein
MQVSLTDKSFVDIPRTLPAAGKVAMIRSAQSEWARVVER